MNSTIIIHTENKEQENVVKAFAEALKMKFEVTNEEPYGPEFVAKIQKSEKEFEEGKGIAMTVDECKALCK